MLPLLNSLVLSSDCAAEQHREFYLKTEAGPLQTSYGADCLGVRLQPCRPRHLRCVGVSLPPGKPSRTPSSLISLEGIPHRKDLPSPLEFSSA